MSESESSQEFREVEWGNHSHMNLAKAAGNSSEMKNPLIVNRNGSPGPGEKRQREKETDLTRGRASRMLRD